MEVDRERIKLLRFGLLGRVTVFESVVAVPLSTRVTEEP